MDESSRAVLDQMALAEGDGADVKVFSDADRARRIVDTNRTIAALLD